MLVYAVFCLLVLHFHLVSSTPFLYGPTKALTSLAASASSSASNPSASLTNIADLRRRQDKSEKLQEEKEVVETDDGDNWFSEGDTDDKNNEVAPSLLQKKVNKILTKLRFLSGLTNVVTRNDNETSKDDEFKKQSEEFDEEFKDDVFNKDGKAQDNYTSQPLNEEPVKITLDINARTADDDNEKVNEEATDGLDISDGNFQNSSQTMSKLGQIGVFFVELLGSLVGLAYGAAAHINNAVQGSTAPTFI